LLKGGITTPRQGQPSSVSAIGHDTSQQLSRVSSTHSYWGVTNP